MTNREKKLIFLSGLLSILMIGFSYLYVLGSGDDGVASASEFKNNVSTSTVPELGDPGSDHSHMVFALSIEGNIYNFNRDKYAEQSNRVHFHHGDGLFLHKHATGVTLPYTLKTLGMELSDECLILDTGDEYCEEGDKRISMVVNGNIVDQPKYYEFQHGDRILLDYSNDDFIDLRIRAQSLPEENEWPRNLRESVYKAPK